LCFFQWTTEPDPLLWNEFKGQVLRVAMKCTFVVSDKVNVKNKCMLMKVSGQKGTVNYIINLKLAN